MAVISNIRGTTEFPVADPNVRQNPWVKLEPGRYTIAVTGEFNGATCLH